MIGEVCLAIEMGADAVDIGKTIHPPSAKPWAWRQRWPSGSCDRRTAGPQEVNLQDPVDNRRPPGPPFLRRQSSATETSRGRLAGVFGGIRPGCCSSSASRGDLRADGHVAFTPPVKSIRGLRRTLTRLNGRRTMSPQPTKTPVRLNTARPPTLLSWPDVHGRSPRTRSAKPSS